MRWRESLPARIALSTIGLCVLVLLGISTAAYISVASMLRAGIDRSLLSSFPMAAAGVVQYVQVYTLFSPYFPSQQHVQVLSPRGEVLTGTFELPVDQAAVNEAMRYQPAYVTLIPQAGRLVPRSGAQWWQDITPKSGQLRVVYVRGVYTQDQDCVYQVTIQMQSTGEVLAQLMRRLVWFSVLGLLLCGLIVWRNAGQFYRPVRAIIAAADAITTRTLDTRINDSWHDRTLRQLTTVLNAMITRLQTAFNAQGRFVAAAAHELRSPLAAMRAELEVTLRRERTPQEYREALAGALEETRRLSTLAEHLLILARLERGTALTTEPDLALTPILERAASEVERATGAAVTVQVPADLRLDGDPIALERLVTNLAQNGIQAGGAPVQIAATGDRGGITINVTDLGSGIPESEFPKLFEPFYRGDAARTRTGGAGLGLTIVKAIVDAHQGKIELASRPGQTTVRVWLPSHPQEPPT